MTGHNERGGDECVGTPVIVPAEFAALESLMIGIGFAAFVERMD